MQPTELELQKCDYHIHTKYSFDGARDGSGELDAIAEAAIAAGLKRIALCDHCDIDGELEGIYPHFELEQIRQAVAAAKAKYADRLEILAGIELGQPQIFPDEARDILARGEYDFVLGSLHNLRGYPDFYFLKLSLMTPEHIDILVRRAIREQCEIANFTWTQGSQKRHIDTLTHITYIGRYLTKEGLTFDFMRYEKQWRELFHILIENGIALEINTSGLRSGYTTMPNKELVELYKDCGGKRFTLGSDAHTARDVGKGLSEACALLGL